MQEKTNSNQPTSECSIYLPWSPIHLYHTAASLSPRRTKSFVFARPASHWLDGRNLLFRHSTIKIYKHTLTSSQICHTVFKRKTNEEKTTTDKRVITNFIAVARVAGKYMALMTKTDVKYLILNKLLSRDLPSWENTKKIQIYNWECKTSENRNVSITAVKKYVISFPLLYNYVTSIQYNSVPWFFQYKSPYIIKR